MAYWLLKTEPEEYSFDDLLLDGKTVWDGVTNNWALTYLRQMQKGDKTLIYHTGNSRQIVGIAVVDSAVYPDPKRDNIKLVVVDIVPYLKLKIPIHLKDLKNDPFFNDMPLVRFSRLSVMPVEKKHWDKILFMAE